MRGVSILIAGCLLLGMAGAGDGSDSEKEAALEKAEALMESAAWKKAIKALKSYRKKYAKSDEERAEVEALILRAEGEKEFAEIDKKYRRSSKIKPAVKSIKKFIAKYKEDDELLRRSEQFYEALRSKYVAVITDFEGDDWPETDDGMVPEDGEGMVRHGLQSARWRTGIGSRWVHIIPEFQDWTPYTYFCFWIYSAEKPRRPGYIFIRPGIAGGGWEHHFEYVFPVDFKGWRKVKIEFRGKRGFARMGKPNWASIEEVQFHHPGESGIALDVVIDDVRLEKAVR